MSNNKRKQKNGQQKMKIMARARDIKVVLGGIIVMIILILQSCDPVKILVIKTASEPNASVTIYYSKDYFARQGVEYEKEKAILRISATDTSMARDTVLYYGLGGWGKSFPELYNNMDSIVIISSNERVVLDNQSEIDTYLTTKRSGFAKRILTIEAK